VPVVPANTWYRLRKFVRRNRAQTFAGALVACGLVVGLGTSLWALRVADDVRRELERKNEELLAKADEGFKLLANEERLAAALAAERTLPPPWPEHAAAYAAWLADFADPLLVAEQPKLHRKLEELAAARASNGDRRADPADEHLLLALGRLDAALRRFADGPVARVRTRAQAIRDVFEPAAREHERAWQVAVAAIKQSDGIAASARYRGVQLPALPGLVPLGCHPRTLLFEFLDLASHSPSEPLPERDARSGDLRTGPQTGIVFVLLPPGTLSMGALREPGLPQSDPNAEDDERPVQMVQIEEFLLARTELTAAQWARLCGETLPADVLGSIAASGIDWPTARDVLRRFDLDLPTEAQWEYGCRAGSTTPWWCGADADAAIAHGWFGVEPQPVALVPANAFGLCDVHGNLAEWCLDDYVDYAAVPARTSDGLRRVSDAETAAPRVVRGGACREGPLAARSSARQSRLPGTRESRLGLRPMRAVRARGR
jgi:formylglycine-generating enzyme required for sulfatase activity